MYILCSSTVVLIYPSTKYMAPFKSSLTHSHLWLLLSIVQVHIITPIRPTITDVIGDVTVTSSVSDVTANTAAAERVLVTSRNETRHSVTFGLYML